MKKTIALLCAGFLSVSVFASDGLASEPMSLRDQCHQKVADTIDLEDVRNRLRGYKTSRSTDYYEVYRMFRGYRISSKEFTPLKQLAGDIQLSASMAISRCVHFFGDMDDSKPETSKNVALMSANEMLRLKTLPMIDRFEQEFVSFVESRYGMR